MSKMLNLTYCPQCSSGLVCTLKIRRFGVKYHSVFLRVVRKTLLKSHSGITHQKRLMSNKLFIFQLPNFMAVSKGGTGTWNLGRGTWDLGRETWEVGAGSWESPSPTSPSPTSPSPTSPSPTSPSPTSSSHTSQSPRPRPTFSHSLLRVDLENTVSKQITVKNV